MRENSNRRVSRDDLLHAKVLMHDAIDREGTTRAVSCPEDTFRAPRVPPPAVHGFEALTPRTPPRKIHQHHRVRPDLSPWLVTLSNPRSHTPRARVHPSPCSTLSTRRVRVYAPPTFFAASSRGASLAANTRTHLSIPLQRSDRIHLRVDRPFKHSLREIKSIQSHRIADVHARHRPNVINDAQLILRGYRRRRRCDLSTTTLVSNVVAEYE